LKTLEELEAVYELPLPVLILRAAEVHQADHDYRDIQRCALQSIKAGAARRTAPTAPRARGMPPRCGPRRR
jgi:hypothetical protein